MTLFTGLAAMPAPTRRLQRACACAAGKGDCEECRKKKPQRRAADSTTAVSALDMASFEGGGTRLAPSWRRRLEPAFGTGFESVRIHDDASSHSAARALHAHAFTVGQHVHFAAGRFAPHTPDGLHLLAHELTHTVQQRGASAAGPALASTLDMPDAPLEREADAQADAVLAGRAQSALARAPAGEQPGADPPRRDFHQGTRGALSRPDSRGDAVGGLGQEAIGAKEVQLEGIKDPAGAVVDFKTVPAMHNRYRADSDPTTPTPVEDKRKGEGG